MRRRKERKEKANRQHNNGGEAAGKKHKVIMRSWPHLPEQMQELVKRQIYLILETVPAPGFNLKNPLQNLHFSGVNKAWRSSPRQCCSQARPTHHSTWLEEIFFTDQTTHYISTLPNYGRCSLWFYRRWPSGRDLYKCSVVGSSNGRLVMATRAASLASDSEYYIQFGGTSSMLPPLNSSVEFRQVALSSSWFYPCADERTALALPVNPHLGFMFYTIGAGRERQWIQEGSSLCDPNSPPSWSQERRAVRFTNAIWFQGKFYALTMQGTLATIEVDSHGLSRPRVALLSGARRRAVPSVSCLCFREYLMESCGEILLVFLISRKSSLLMVDEVEVFRLDHDVSNLSWIKMNSLGDRTLFVGIGSCMWVAASEVGCKANCIYFTHYTSDGWWVFDMKSGGISPGWSADSANKSPVWVEPSLQSFNSFPRKLFIS
uniref:KIB1-4 beta-propeller domain-containing protein n=1 Tax=Nelumbo nucifera TaxID=4432 RepID=A0A822YZ44_NELNU|nr:TPA_asm: hypothetical protein HUJ06_008603 [Nelumbo nucifera]